MRLVFLAVLLLLASRPSLAQDYWYFCKSRGLYYPYATTCAEPWLTVDSATGRQTPAQGVPGTSIKPERAPAEAKSTQESPKQESPTLLVKYKAKVRPYYEMQGQAEMAYECGLRSWRWNVALINASEMAKANATKDFNLPREYSGAVEAYFQETYFNATRKFSCATLANSPTMEKLDRLANMATGGYH